MDTDVYARLLGSVTALERTLVALIKSQPEAVRADVIAELTKNSGTGSERRAYGEAFAETSERIVNDLR